MTVALLFSRKENRHPYGGSARLSLVGAYLLEVLSCGVVAAGTIELNCLVDHEGEEIKRKHNIPILLANLVTPVPVE